MWSSIRLIVIEWLCALDVGSRSLQIWLLMCILNAGWTYYPRACFWLCLKWQQGLFACLDISSFSHSDLNFQWSFNIGNSFFSFMQHHFLFQDQLVTVSRGHQKHSSWSWHASAGSQFHSCMQSLASPGLQIHQCLVLRNFRWIHASVKKHTKTLQLTSSSLWRIQSKHKQGGNSVFSFTLWISGNGF